MLFRASLLAVVAAIYANQVIGAAFESENQLAARAALIATTSYYACNCPNNCSHKVGSSCKYYSGPSDTSTIISGKCENEDGQLNCIAT